MGDPPLRAARRSHILTALANRPDLSGKTVNNYTSVAREALDLAVDDRLLQDPLANSVEWWFFSGPRTSEAIGLRWSKMDLRSGHMLIDEAVVRGERKDTKTSTARDVILNSRALAALTRQKAHTLLAGAEVWQDPR